MSGILAGRWKGRWAVVTGASSGLGEAFALTLAGQTTGVVLAGRDYGRLQQVAAAVRAAGTAEVRVLVGDLEDPLAMQALLEMCAPLDVRLLVAAAGAGSSGHFLDQPLAREAGIATLNAVRVLELAHHFGRRFRAAGDGGLVLFSSIVAFQGVPGSATYAASKAFVQSLAEALHIELAPVGVHVLAVAPGPVSTRFGERAGLGMSGAAEPLPLARAALRALGRRRATIRPGSLSKLLGWSLATLPRPLRVLLMQKIMDRMIAGGSRAGAVP